MIGLGVVELRARAVRHREYPEERAALRQVPPGSRLGLALQVLERRGDTALGRRGDAGGLIQPVPVKREEVTESRPQDRLHLGLGVREVSFTVPEENLHGLPRCRELFCADRLLGEGGVRRAEGGRT